MSSSIQLPRKERRIQLHTGVGNSGVQLAVRQRTLKEVEAGALIGPTELADIPSPYPSIRRFGVQQGSKMT